MEITQHTPEKHPVLGCKAYVYKRGRSNYWQCAAYLRGYNYRASTREATVLRVNRRFDKSLPSVR
jgi:hypothetical protein